MCGTAGAIDLTGNRRFPRERILAMTGALAHRGPDDEQVHLEPGLALGVRRLSVIDVAGGRQPLCNEDGQIWVAYEGEMFNYPELRPQLLQRGHILKTSCDTEAWVHLYEDHKEDVFNIAQGQFAVALWDRNNRTLLLGRDRAGIAPLFYTISDGWLLWASEIKALLASGLVDAQPDRLGLDYFFHFFAASNTRTCFQGVHSLPPGHYLNVRDGKTHLRQYWDLDFPDAGDERQFETPKAAAEELEELLRAAMRRRLAGEVPICSYLSGGLDSTMILGLATQERGGSVPSLTIGLNGSGPNDETGQAAESAELLGSSLTTVRMERGDIAEAYPELIRAAEHPVLDTSAACMIRLAQAAREQGYLVSVTGEGSDESLAGYVWFKIDQFARMTGRPLNPLLRKLSLSRMGGNRHRVPWFGTGGKRVAQQITWEMMAQSRELLYSDDMWSEIGDYQAYDELMLNRQRFQKWHPLNRSLYMAHRVMLSGMLLSAKGDRTLRNGSTEGRFPFLDETVVDFCAQLPPNYKLRGMKDKWLLRQVASNVLPRQIAKRPKTMFRADFSYNFLGPNRPAWVDQLLSPESLHATGYFNSEEVRKNRAAQLHLPRISFRRFVMDMGLMGVISTQLWHHTFMGGGLADLPAWSPRQQVGQSLAHDQSRVESARSDGDPSVISANVE